MKWSDPSLTAGDNLDEDLFLFVRNKLRGVRFASLEELAHERITVHLLEQLQLLIKPRQNCDTKLNTRSYMLGRQCGDKFAT